jgi:hypothetical protein
MQAEQRSENRSLKWVQKFRSHTAIPGKVGQTLWITAMKGKLKEIAAEIRARVSVKEAGAQESG